MKKLTILDLDNTLIFGTVDRHLRAKILCHFSKLLVIYERPYAREFVTKCQKIGDVAVFTTAVREYAEQVCEHLGIKPIGLFSREDSIVVFDRYVKSVPDYYFDVYDEITIVDDLPEIWDTKSHQECRIIRVSEFIGNVKDDELMKIQL